MGPKKENQRYFEKGSQLPQPQPHHLQQSRMSLMSKERALRPRELKTSEQRQLDQIITFLQSFSSNLSGVLRLMEHRLRDDSVKEKAFEKLYQELDELKEDKELNQLRPLYNDLILFHDRMENIYKDALESGKLSPELSELLKSLNGELMEILYRRGVEPIILTSHTFDPKYQEVVKTIPTDNRAEDNQIVDIVRNGFKYKNVIIRHTKVVIKKYQGK